MEPVAITDIAILVLPVLLDFPRCSPNLPHRRCPPARNCRSLTTLPPLKLQSRHTGLRKRCHRRWSSYAVAMQDVTGQVHVIRRVDVRDIDVAVAAAAGAARVKVRRSQCSCRRKWRSPRPSAEAPSTTRSPLACTLPALPATVMLPPIFRSPLTRIAGLSDGGGTTTLSCDSSTRDRRTTVLLGPNPVARMMSWSLVSVKPVPSSLPAPGIIASS